MDRVARHTLIASFLVSLAACGEAPKTEAADGEWDDIATGKADGAIDPDSDEAQAVLLLVNDKYGPGVFRDFLLGRYFQPKREERIFMFLDIKSSTTIAE